MAEHMSTFDTDTDDGWPVASCSCGWRTGSVPDMEIAADSWGDHLASAVAVGLATEWRGACDVRDRIIDRLAPGDDGWAWFPVLPGDFDANADDAPCWVRFDDSGRRRLDVASPEPMAPDEAAYFERRASDG